KIQKSDLSRRCRFSRYGELKYNHFPTRSPCALLRFPPTIRLLARPPCPSRSDQPWLSCAMFRHLQRGSISRTRHDLESLLCRLATLWGSADAPRETFSLTVTLPR